MAHECPDCGQYCYCDGEDLDQPPPVPCHCPCWEDEEDEESEEHHGGAQCLGYMKEDVSLLMEGPLREMFVQVMGDDNNHDK